MRNEIFIHFFRFVYWLQLHEKFGPIVINMSRVINDIITIAVTYLIICIGFSFGMIILLDEKVVKLTPKAAIKGKFSIPKTGNHQVLLCS